MPGVQTPRRCDEGPLAMGQSAETARIEQMVGSISVVMRLAAIKECVLEASDKHASSQGRGTVSHMQALEAGGKLKHFQQQERILCVG
jgi:hypothetical protein